MRKLFQIVVVAMTVPLAASVASCSSGSSPASPGPLYSANSATKVSAQELFASYSKSKATANKLYKGKLLEVTGAIHNVGTDPILSDAPEVMLSGGALNGARGVVCTFDKRYASQVAQLRTGQTVAVLGICEGFAVNVVLLRCQPAKE